jgi:hypothetical protein
MNKKFRPEPVGSAMSRRARQSIKHFSMRRKPL